MNERLTKRCGTYSPTPVCKTLIHDARSGLWTNEGRQTEISVSEIRAVGGVQGISQYLLSFITAWNISCRQVIDIPAHDVQSPAATTPV